MRYILTLLFICAMSLVSSASIAQETDNVPNETQQLIDLLEDPEARQVLIDSLKQVAAPAESAEAQGEEPESFGRFVAEATTEAAQTIVSSITGLWSRILAAPSAFEGLSADQVELLIEALWELARIIVTTTLVYLGLRILFRRAARRMTETAKDKGTLRLFWVLLGVSLLDLMILFVAWGAGYLAALLLYGEVGVIGVRQSLFLNAFLAVGIAKVILRAVLAPRLSALRFVPVSDAAARFMSRWFGIIIMVIGYGQMLIVPIVSRQASVMVGRGMSTLLALIAILIAAWVTLRSRRAVADWLLTDKAREDAGIMRFVARRWHVPVLIYLFGLFLIVAARPDGLIWPVLVTSAQVIGVIVGGFFLSGMLSRAIANGVRLPATVTDKLPALESRLNAVVPKILFALRALIVFGVVAFTFGALGLYDTNAWLKGAAGRDFTSTLVSVTIMLLIGLGLWLALVSWVDYRLNPDFGSVPTSREQTLLTLFRNAATVVLIVILLMFVLSEMGIDIAPLIASAGVLGLAIGFGAQKLVQDIITGIFIQFENMMNVGDVVTLGGTTGVVEKLTIRSVSLRDLHGVFHVIPFSSVDMVSNYVKEYGMFVADIGIAYREKVEDGKAAMMAAFEEVKQGELGKFIQGDFQWFGVQSLGDSAVVLRGRIKCAAGQQWAVGREYNEICKRIMDERGIEIPFPHQTVFFGENKDGSAPPLRIANKEE